jgi:flagellar biosynthetic protein FlhB
MAEHAQERTEQATPRRRQEARRKGTVAKSADLTSALVMFALAIFLPALGAGAVIGLMDAMRNGLRAGDAFSIADVGKHFATTAGPAVRGLLPVACLGLVVGLAANFMQVGFVLSAESMNPDIKRINPIEGAKRLFSRRSLFEFAKTLVKLTLVGYIAYSDVAGNWDETMHLSQMPAASGVAWIGSLVVGILLKVAVAWLVLGTLDYMFQRKQVDKQLMMTKDELKREMKEAETSPELRAEMQRRRRKLARQRMMQNVKQADAIITNPIEYAIALKYDAKKMAAPVVLAKGRHLLAERIRDEAKKHRVPIVPNPPLARSLYKEVEVGDAIPTTLFQAVAEVLAYVFRQRRQ